MESFEILCVTMNQSNFSKVEEMNIRANVIFANQSNTTLYEEKKINGKTARMITTETRGVGVNRNLALLYSNAEIVLFSDDDLRYIDDLENVILTEFQNHVDADIIIFNLETIGEYRKQRIYDKGHKCGIFEKMPWGACRIACRSDSLKKKNLWFSTLFGGGCIFSSGEDSLWLKQAKKQHMNIYVSDKIIGSVSFENSTWFHGFTEKVYYGKGAFYAAAHPYTAFFWILYFAIRTRSDCQVNFKSKIHYMLNGMKGYKMLIPFEKFKDR